MFARTKVTKPKSTLLALACACALTATGCSNASRNAPGTTDPGIVPPSAEEIGEAAKQSVGADGGSVGTPSQTAFAAVPPGALPGNVTLSVSVAGPEGMPLEGNLLTNVYNFGPDGTQFSKRVILTVAVGAAPNNNQRAMLAWLDANQTWQPLLDSGYNPGTSAVTATTTHFTPFTVVAYGKDGGGCAQQSDPDAFCGLWQMVCDMPKNVCGPSAFTIGGYVQGLKGSISLIDNLGDVVVLGADGNFTFPGSYDVGESYVVSIADAPQDQNCTVVAATAHGTITDAPVTDIAVICAAGALETFPIGGVVSGLDANQRVTLAQGTQTVTVSNGDFVFANELPLQTDYVVTVAVSPPGKICTVTRGAEGLVDGFSLDIRVVCEPATPNVTKVGGSVVGLGAGLTLELENLADPNDRVAIAANGNFIAATAIYPGGDFNIIVATQPQGQICLVQGGQGVATLAAYWGVMVACVASVQMITGQSAALVIGEPDFFSENASGAVSASLTRAPRGSAWGAPDGALYLADTGAYRALVYNAMPMRNGMAADGVLGQSGPTQTVPATPGNATGGSGGFAGIGGEGNTLLMADPIDHRVLVFASLPSSNTDATVVIGQQALMGAANLPGCSAAGLHAPSGVSMAGGKVVVADTGNHRVLVYESVPTSHGVAADVVLGQADFNTCTSPLPAGVGAATLWGPQGVWTDGTRLLVADTNANRVLVWQSFPRVSKQPADAVIGQPNFASTAISASKMSTSLPSGVASDGFTVWTSSLGFNRVEQWAFPTAPGPGAAATAVLGHSSFTDTSVNACNCSAPNAAGLNAPGGVALVAGTLVVADTGNNRYVIFAGE